MRNDVAYMKRALLLAREGVRAVSPNPMVGAVLVKNGRVIGEGYHRIFGEPHAEIEAIANAKENVSGAVLYVSLEPCCFYGKTPPCIDAIIKAGINEVVVAMQDPNPKVCGKGIAILRRAGISVRVGVLEKEARELNKFFIKYITTGLPYVTMKIAATIDGKIARKKGKKSDITGPVSQKLVHRLRAMHDAVLTGVGTVSADNPHLGVRYARGKDPLRVILGKNLSPSARVRRDKNFMLFEDDNADLKNVLKKFAHYGISSVMIEAGNALNTAFLKKGLADEIQLFIAQKYFGDKALPAFFGDLDFALKSIQTVGSDFLFIFNRKSLTQ